MKGVKLGFCMSGSFCTHKDALVQMRKLKDMGADITAVFSYTTDAYDTRFYTAKELREEVLEITGKDIINTIVGAEPVGPERLFDIIVVAPCTGNTMAKLANAITDTPVLMAIKAQLRNGSPVVLSIATNDALSNNAKNLGALLNLPNVYLVPLSQDAPFKKARSIVSDMSKLPEAVQAALEGQQLQPIIYN
ncbi:MAG TPA: dipicolinate synthase subunit B [Bacillota bacterium]|nr:dipicolinate synthase subunit B [Bacillota bacterium]